MADWMLIDGSSLIFRAFFAIPATVRSPDGRPVNGVRGFMDILSRLLTDRRPQRLVVASDDDWRPQWRVDLIPSYKTHRTAEPVPRELEPQFPVIHEILAAIGVDFVGVPDFEAEDVIAGIAARVPGSKDIVSGDRDLFALVHDPDVRVLYPERGGMSVIDEKEVEKRFGVPGRLYADYAILRGDPSDGLPGVKGVGSKTAAELVRKHAGLEGLIAAGRLKASDVDYLNRARQVVMPRADLPLEIPTGIRDQYPEHLERTVQLSRKHGLESATERLVTALTLPR